MAVVVVWLNRRTMFSRDGAVTEVIPAARGAAPRPRGVGRCTEAFFSPSRWLWAASPRPWRRRTAGWPPRWTSSVSATAFPGATAAIALPDGTVMTAATGLADVEAGRAMTPETPMLAASIGKSFVAATVLALESEGRLSRDDLLSVHLGDRPWFDALPNAGTITIDHLLHHTSGLPDHVHLPEFQRAWAGLVDGPKALRPRAA